MSQKITEAPVGAPPEPEQRTIAVGASGSTLQNNMRNIRLIIGREYKAQVRQLSFKLTTVLFVLLALLGPFVPTVIQIFTSHNKPQQTSVRVVNNAGNVAGLDNASLSRSIGTILNGASTSSTPTFAITVSSSDELASLQKQVKDGKLDVLLVLERSADQTLRFTYYTNNDAGNDGNSSQVQSLVQQLNALDKMHRLGLTQAQIGSLYAPPNLSTVDVQPKNSQDTRSTSEIVTDIILAYVGDVLVFVAVLLYGMGVAMGVGEEKGSRVMEILVNAATPFQLMVGKIVGIGAAGLTQMVVVVAVGIGSFLLQIPLQAAIFGSHGGGLPFAITGAAIPFLLYLLLYFILGFLLYATIMAGAGALVKRQEEARNAVQFPMMLMMAGYIAGEVGVYAANSSWMKILSFIPFFTPTTMLVRIAAGQVAWWEIVITIPLMLITIALCAWISSRIYRSGILMYGQKPTLRQLVKLMGK